MAKQYKVFHAILYPDSTTYDYKNALSVCSEKYSEWAYITHDKDVYPEEILDDEGNVVHCKGELKKAHIHLAIHCQDRYPTAISNALGIPLNDIEFTTNQGKGITFRHVVRYLIHADNPDKFQYNKEDITTNIQDINKYFDYANEGFMVKEFCDLRLQGKSYYDILQYSLEHDCFSAFSRHASLVKLCVDDKLSRDKISVKAYLDAYNDAHAKLVNDSLERGNYGLNEFEQVTLSEDFFKK